MKLLLDEDLDVKLRYRFGPEHEYEYRAANGLAWQEEW